MASGHKGWDPAMRVPRGGKHIQKGPPRVRAPPDTALERAAPVPPPPFLGSHTALAGVVLSGRNAVLELAGSQWCAGGRPPQLFVS